SDIDCHGLEEFLTPCPPRAAGGVEHRESRLAEQPPRERHAVRVDPGARQPADDIPRTYQPPINHLGLPHDAEAGPREIEIPHDLRDDRNLAADNRDVRELRASVQPDADLSGHFAIVRLNRNVVDEGEGLRADADHVVHVMRDAVDPDRVPAAHLPRDERFRADAVRAERQRVGAQVNESGEVADLREGRSDASTSVREGGDEGCDVRGLFVLAYAGLGIAADRLAPRRRHPYRNRTRRMTRGPVLRRTLLSSQNGYGSSYIIAFPRGERNYSPLVNMLSRRWKGFMERRRFVPAMGKAWIKARKHDRFYRAAKKQEYRSRAAIKLSQIDLRYGVFHDGDLVVDLGAAPGGWSQIARERIGAKGRVVAVDLARMAPIEGVEVLRGDFTRSEVQATLFEAIRRPADIVMSDVAPKRSGNRPL